MSDLIQNASERTLLERHLEDCRDSHQLFNKAIANPGSELRIHALVDSMYQAAESGRQLGVGFLGLTALSSLESDLAERTHLHRFALVHEDEDTDFGVILNEQLAVYEVYDRVRAQLIHDEAVQVL